MDKLRGNRVAHWAVVAAVVALGLLATLGAAVASADAMLAASRVLMALAIAGLVAVVGGVVRELVLDSRRHRGGDDGRGGGGGGDDEPDWPFPPGHDPIEEELQRILREEASRLR